MDAKSEWLKKLKFVIKPRKFNPHIAYSPFEEDGYIEIYFKKLTNEMGTVDPIISDKFKTISFKHFLGYVEFLLKELIYIQVMNYVAETLSTNVSAELQNAYSILIDLNDLNSTNAIKNDLLINDSMLESQKAFNSLFLKLDFLDSSPELKEFKNYFSIIKKLDYLNSQRNNKLASKFRNNIKLKFWDYCKYTEDVFHKKFSSPTRAQKEFREFVTSKILSEPNLSYLLRGKNSKSIISYKSFSKTLSTQRKSNHT